MPAERQYSRYDYQNAAWVIRTELDIHGPAPVLARLVTAFAQLFTSDVITSNAMRGHRFDGLRFRHFALRQDTSMPRRTTTRSYTARHYQDVAGLLAAERAAHDASPALNRIITAFTELFTEDAAQSGTNAFSPELFGRAARGEVPATTRPERSRQDSRPAIPDWEPLLRYEDPLRARLLEQLTAMNRSQ